MDFDHSANCHWRLFGRPCSCDAPQRAREEKESLARMTESGVMPLASEVALQQETDSASKTDRKAESETLLPVLQSAVDDATAKLVKQGLTLVEALSVIERRIRG